MTRRRSPVNREGLAGLLQASAELAQAPAAEQMMDVASLRPGASQPRREFGAASLDELARSIAEQGVLQPLLVRVVEGRHEIVAGERRWRAAQLAGVPSVPVIVRDFTDQQARHVALTENLLRENLNMLDEVDAKLDLVANALALPREDARRRMMQMLREAPGADHETLTLLFGTLGETWMNFAKTKVRVLNWPAAILAAVRGGLPYTVAGVIVGAPQAAHESLLALAATGASRESVKAAAQRWQPTQQRPAAEQVAQVLGSRMWAKRLSPAQQQEVQAWLDQMPDTVRLALTGEPNESA